MLKRTKKVFIRKSDIKTIVSYNYFEEETRGIFSGKKIVKHYPKFIIFCSIEKSKPYTRWFRTDEEMNKAIDELISEIENKDTEFIMLETIDM
jgi:hypothetical protein